MTTMDTTWAPCPACNVTVLFPDGAREASCRGCGADLEVEPEPQGRPDPTPNPAPIMERTLDLGNNESLSQGAFPQHDGRFLALTFTRSRWFKTERGAVRWLKRQLGEDA